MDEAEWEHDGVDHGVPRLVPGRGRDHVARFFESLSAIAFAHFEPLRFFEGDGRVAAFIRVEWKVSSTGGRIRDLEAHLWTFDEEGNVSRFTHLAGTHQHRLAVEGGA